MACRDLAKAEEAAQQIKEELKKEENVGELIVKKLDLSSFKSVREFSKEMLDTEPQINLLVNNAGKVLKPLE
jgi:retinol dehydrogenase-12